MSPLEGDHVAAAQHSVHHPCNLAPNWWVGNILSDDKGGSTSKVDSKETTKSNSQDGRPAIVLTQNPRSWIEPHDQLPCSVQRRESDTDLLHEGYTLAEHSHDG